MQSKALNYVYIDAYGFFHIHTDFIGGIPPMCTPDSSGISKEVLLWIDVDHFSKEVSCNRYL